MRLASLLICLSTVGFAGSWSGYLVDSSCYTSEQNNVSSDAINSRDMNMALRQCAATSRTKKFAIVANDWSSLKLDAAGNRQAAAIVRNAHHETALYCVTVQGTRNGKTILAGPVSTASIRTYAHR